MRQNFIRLISVLLLFSLLAGCSSGILQPADPTPVTISIWTYYNGAQLTSFNALVDQFNATIGKEQGIEVVSTAHGSVADLETAVLNAAQSDITEIPNVFAAYTDTAYAIDQLGLVADLRPYLTDAELNEFVDSYITEGQFSSADSLKIFPIAKSTELMLLNKTDWETFSAATGATYEDFATIEGLTRTAQAYYEWTDSLTPEPDDGKAFFGRDAMANYFLVGAMQLGVELFSVENGKMTLHFDREVIRKLWDNYYVPFVKGYFAASGRFRSDDVKTGNILAFVGSSSGATFFPAQVNLTDTESHPIEMETFPCPQFTDGQPYAVQQGAGMVVTSGTDEQVAASVTFLKWFTENQQNIRFSVDSGYLPVRKSANSITEIRAALSSGVTPVMEKILDTAIGTVNDNTLYTPMAFSNGSSARKVLEYAMSDLAAADRATVKERIAAGQSMEEAVAEFVSDEYFESWYTKTLTQLEAFVG